MSPWIRVVSVIVSVGAGITSSILVNLITNGWTWPLVVALVVTAVGLVVSQLALTNPATPNTVASGPGAIASGDRINADVESHVDGEHSPGQASGMGVTASGPGSIAAGRSIKGRIRLWVGKR